MKQSRGTANRAGSLSPVNVNTEGRAMHIDRAHADRYLAFLGFTLSFLFLLAIVAFAFTVTSDTTVVPARPVAATVAK